MNKFVTAIFCSVIFALSVHGQLPSTHVGVFREIVVVSSTPPNYIVEGNFISFQSRRADSVRVGDVYAFEYSVANPKQTVRARIAAITVVGGARLRLTLTLMDGASLIVFPSVVANIYRPTPQGLITNDPNIPAYLFQGLLNYNILKIDSILTVLLRGQYRVKNKYFSSTGVDLGTDSTGLWAAQHNVGVFYLHLQPGSSSNLLFNVAPPLANQYGRVFYVYAHDDSPTHNIVIGGTNRLGLIDTASYVMKNGETVMLVAQQGNSGPQWFFYKAGDVIGSSGSGIAQTKKLYRPSFPAIPTKGYIPVNANNNLASTTAADSIHVGYAIAVQGDSITVQYSGLLRKNAHGLTPKKFYYLQDNGTEGITPDATINALTVYVVDANNLFLTEQRPIYPAPTTANPIGPAGGDLSGTYPNPVIANNVIDSTNIRQRSITLEKLAPGLATNGQVPAFNATTQRYEPVTPIGLSNISDSVQVRMRAGKPNPLTTFIKNIVVDTLGVDSVWIWNTGSYRLFQTGSITLTGPVTGTGTTTIATDIADDAVDSTNIAQRALPLGKLAPGTATNGQVPRWNSTTGVFEPVTLSTAPSGAAGGFLSGTYPNPTALGGTLTGTGGAGFLGLPGQSSNPSSPGSGVRIFTDSQEDLSWINFAGQVSAFVDSLQTASRRYYLPNASGQLVLSPRATGIPAGQLAFGDAGANITSNANAQYSSTTGGLLIGTPAQTITTSSGQLVVKNNGGLNGTQVFSDGFSSATPYVLGSGWAVTSGVGRATAATGNLSLASPFAVVVGRRYLFSYTGVITSGSANITIGGQSIVFAAGTIRTVAVTATTTDPLVITTSTFSGTIDNLIVEEYSGSADVPAVAIEEPTTSTSWLSLRRYNGGFSLTNNNYPALLSLDPTLLIGHNVGSSAMTRGNILIGSSIANTIQAGALNNVIIGRGITGITTGIFNVGIGGNIGVGTSAIGNVVIGETSGITLSSGGGNILIGRNVGNSIATSANNTSVGNGSNAASGENNTVYGANNGPAGTSSNNTIIGNNVSQLLSNGINNVFAGGLILRSATQANGNAIVGRTAAENIAGGLNFNSNSILGTSAMQSVYTANDNVAIGNSSFLGQGTILVNNDFSNAADFNVGTGWVISGGVATATAANGSITLVTPPTIVSGNRYIVRLVITRTAGTVTVTMAGQTFITASVTQSPAISLFITTNTPAISINGSGFSGTVDDLTITEFSATNSSVTRSVAIGSLAGDNVTGITANNVIIGGNAIDLPVANGSNQLNIQNLIWGTGANGTGVTPAGRVSIGTTTADASAILDVASTTQGSRPFPSMTSVQFGAISSPAQALFAYDLTANGLRWWNGTRSAFAVEGVAARGTHRRVPFFDVNGQLKDTIGFGYNTGGRYITSPTARIGFDQGNFYNGLTANMVVANFNNVGLAVVGDMNNASNLPLSNPSLAVVTTATNRPGIFNCQNGILGDADYEIEKYAIVNQTQSGNNILNFFSETRTSSIVYNNSRVLLDSRTNFGFPGGNTTDSIVFSMPVIHNRFSDRSYNGAYNRIRTLRYLEIISPTNVRVNRRTVLTAHPMPTAPRDIFLMQYGTSMTSHFQGTVMIGDTTIATQNLDIAGDVRVRDSLEVDVTPQHTSITGLLTRDANGWVGQAATGDQFTYTGGTLNVQRLTEPYHTITSTSSPQTLSSTISDNLINQGSTQSTFQLNFPPSPVNGQVLKITFVNAINTLTLNGNGNSIIGSAVTVATEGTQRVFKFYTGVGWVRQN